MIRTPLLSDSLYDLVFWLPQRLRLHHNPEANHFMFQVQTRSKWRSIYEIGTAGCYPTEIFSDSTLEYALRQEIEKKGWIWNVSALSVEDGALPSYSAQVSKENSFSHSPTMIADSPAHALCLALLNTIKTG